MKKLINMPEQVVEEMLDGMILAHPELRKLEDYNCIVRADAPVAGKVGLVSGGGSGHEPSHAGFVGAGMLDGACAGKVFSSPTPDHFAAACQAVDAGQGVLLIVKNYSGDVMNTELAAEMCADDGVTVERVIVADDVAVEDSTYTTGRRGIAGTVLVHKIAGAKAVAGGSLAEVKGVAEKTIANLRSMGVALSPCIVPAAGKPGFTLEVGEMEIGMGIHGEPGINRGPLQCAAEITKSMLDRILPDLPFAKGDEVAVLVNGLGATPLMELYIVMAEAAKMLDAAGITIHRSYVGNYMTALEMAGCSLTLLKLDDELKELLDAPADTPALTQR